MNISENISQLTIAQMNTTATVDNTPTMTASTVFSPASPRSSADVTSPSADDVSWEAVVSKISEEFMILKRPVKENTEDQCKHLM